MRLALFQPDIPQNLGAAIRVAACFGAGLDVIEPCGFPLTDKGIRRAAMDYLPLVEIVRHAGWNDYVAGPRRPRGRIVLLSTGATTALWDFAFRRDDTILLGRESAGVPRDVAAAADAALRIPISERARSLNVAAAGAIALAEAQRQLLAAAGGREPGAG